METRILGTTEADIRLAAEMIQKGGLVAFPTETVYGLGADALNAEAVGKVYAAKGRPSDNPMIVHIAQKSDMNKLTDGITPEVERLMEAFWPGPLTMVVPAKDVIPKVTTGGLATVGVRMPEDAIARALISAAGVPIAAPSANLSGKPSPTRYTHVAEDLDGRIDAIIAGDDCKAGIESTVVDMTGEVPTILRPGVITREMLREALNGEGAVDPALFEKPDIFNNDGNGLPQTLPLRRRDLLFFQKSRDQVPRRAAVDPLHEALSFLLSAAFLIRHRAVLMRRKRLVDCHQTLAFHACQIGQYRITAPSGLRLQPLHQRPQLRAARLPECAQHHPFPFR